MTKAAIYVRVSTDEQGRAGFSIPEQLRQLRSYAQREGFEIVEEVVDDGYTGSHLDRPGINRIRELARMGEIDVVIATKRDRYSRSRFHRLTWDMDLEEMGIRAIALNDTGNMIGDSVTDAFAEWEREIITERTSSGRYEKAKQGKILAGRLPNYGFKFSQDRDYYEVNEEEMRVVRFIISELVSSSSINGVCRKLDKNGVSPPGHTNKWTRTFVRKCVYDDLYLPHALEDLVELGVTTEVIKTLDSEKMYGVWWYNRRGVKTVRVISPEGKHTVSKQRMYNKPKEEWIPVPVPSSGIPRADLMKIRRKLEGRTKTPKSTERVWELGGGILRCPDCGRALIALARWRGKTKTKKFRYYSYTCRTRHEVGREACSYSRTPNAIRIENEVWEAVKEVMLHPDRLERGLNGYIEEQKKRGGGDAEKEARALLRRIEECNQKRSTYQDMCADGLMERDELREKLKALSQQKEEAEKALEALKERRERLRELEVSRDKILQRYREIASANMERASPRQRQEMYRILDINVWTPLTKGGTFRIVLGGLGDEEVCFFEPTSRR